MRLGEAAGLCVAGQRVRERATNDAVYADKGASETGPEVGHADRDLHGCQL